MKTIDRKDPQLMQKYKKNFAEEEFLDRLNSILETYQEEDYKKLPEKYPTIHIIGAPRSGTTLLTQIMATHLDIGYINNLIAAFWKAPVYGIRLSKKLLGPKKSSSYVSDFGRTEGIDEPHEFGYFWFSLLGYKEMLQDSVDEDSIDWNRLRIILNNMTYAFEKPIMFKSFLIGWHIKKMQEALNKTCFIRIMRNPLDNAISLLYFRNEMLGSVEKWVSMKPKEYHWLKNKKSTEQVVGQVYYLEKCMTEQIDQIPRKNILEVSYEKLCEDPKRVLEDIIILLEHNGAKVDLISDPPNYFEKHVELIDKKLFKQVTDYIKNYYK